jgi:hypothetical protein
MALTDQPYLPLYVDDWMNNNKLKMCSLQAKGLMIQIMCLMHKEDEYGVVLLKAKFKQNDKQIINFASQVAKLANCETNETEVGLDELLSEGCLVINGDKLICPRMVRDAELSGIRAVVGKQGGSSVTKQYGKQGWVYLISDTFDNHKVGLSTNPQNRLYRLRSDLKIKGLEIVDKMYVLDMGKTEDEILFSFNDIRDGEWLKGDYNLIVARFVLLKAKHQANAENGIVINKDTITVKTEQHGNSKNRQNGFVDIEAQNARAFNQRVAENPLAVALARKLDNRGKGQ